MRYLSTVYVTEHRARIRTSKASLLISSPEGQQRIPMESIDSVVLLGGAQITTDALAGCAARQIRVAALRPGGQVRFIVGGPRAGNVHLRLAQYEAAMDDQLSFGLAKLIVGAKIQSSRRLVRRWSRDAPSELTPRLTRRVDELGARLERVGSAHDGDHLRGIEGDAARSYFAAMSTVLADGPLPFVARTRRPPRDPINALLGFGYGLVTTEIVGALEAVGLDHQVGFLHRARSGRPSLALDLLEELRPWVDRFVVGVVRRRQVGPASFTKTPGGAVYLSDQGRQSVLTLWEQAKNAHLPHLLLQRPVERFAVPSIQAALLARHLRADLPAYPPFVLAA